MVGLHPIYLFGLKSVESHFTPAMCLAGPQLRSSRHSTQPMLEKHQPSWAWVKITPIIGWLIHVNIKN